MSFAPTVSDIRRQVMQKLRLDAADQDMATYWINQAYADAAQFTGFLVDEVLLPMPSGATQATLPSTVQQVKELRRISGGNVMSRPAELVRLEELMTKIATGSNSTAASGGVYSIQGRTVWIWPATGAGETLRFTCAGLPPAVADTTVPLIPEPFGSKLLEYGALVEGAKFKKDPLMLDFEQTHAMWMGRFVAWINRMKTLNSRAFEVWTGADEVDRLAAEAEAYGQAAPDTPGITVEDSHLPVTGVDFDIYRGDTWMQKFRFLRGGNPVDLTGASVAATARASGGATYALVVVVIIPTDGQIQLSLPPGSLPIGSYDYDVEVTQGSLVTTWIRGTLNVLGDITNVLP